MVTIGATQSRTIKIPHQLGFVVRTASWAGYFDNNREIRFVAYDYHAVVAPILIRHKPVFVRRIPISQVPKRNGAQGATIPFVEKQFSLDPQYSNHSEGVSVTFKLRRIRPTSIRGCNFGDKRTLFRRVLRVRLPVLCGSRG